MRSSRLPPGGTNLFQEIKKKSAEAEQQGIGLLKLSIGQPQGPALLSAREAAATAVMSDKESMHEYQDNGSPGVPDFARRFVMRHLSRSIADYDVDYLPIPGIKPMLGLVILSCGDGLKKGFKVATTTNPGYPTPRDWCNYLGVDFLELHLNPENSFRFFIDDIDAESVDFIMMNYPHNPTGQIATREWLTELCEFCVEYDIRLFNDAAYIALSYSKESCPLTEVAVNFPELSWAEAFSASKLIGNGTGWRVGAIVGSSDFVGDLKTIKGNTDSGFAAPMAAGALHALESDPVGIELCRQTYRRRAELLISMLTKNRMRLAVKPGAGFFTLWHVPKKAFGVEIKDAKHFNFLMIEKTGVVGVHFHPYIRYAVCSDVQAMADEIASAFKKAEISYE